MLNYLRKKKTAKRILWALTIIIVLAFVLWDAGRRDTKRKHPFKYIGTIEGKKITFDDFIKSVADVQIGLFLNYFNQPQVLDKLQKDRKLLNRLAWENLILNVKAKHDNIAASNQEVVNLITHHPLFVRGKAFDNELYNYLLKHNLGITPRAFEESVRNFLINEKYKADIVKNATISDDEIRQIYKNESEKAKIYYIVIDRKNLIGGVEVSKDEITAYYRDNKEFFKEPEKIVLQYIAFPHKEVAARDKALAGLKKSYEKLKRRPRDMEKITRRLNLTINETPPFSQEEIVPEVGSIKDIGTISYKLRPLIDIVPIIDEEEKGTSYIIRVKEKIPSQIKSEDKVSSYIMDILKSQKAQELAKERIDKLYKEAKDNNIPLKELAKKYNLKLLHTDLISRFDYIEEVGESYEIVEAASKLKVGEISKPIETRKGFALIAPLEFQFIDEERFKEEKVNYGNRALALKKIKALKEWFRKAQADSPLNVDLDKI